METTTIGWDTLAPVVTAITTQFSVTTVLAVIAGVIGAIIGFVFMWWGARFIFKRVTKSAKTGKANI